MFTKRSSPPTPIPLKLVDLWYPCVKKRCPQCFYSIPLLQKHFAESHPDEKFVLPLNLPPGAEEGRIIFKKSYSNLNSESVAGADVSKDISKSADTPLVEGKYYSKRFCGICQKCFYSRSARAFHLENQHGIISCVRGREEGRQGSVSSIELKKKKKTSTTVETKTLERSDRTETEPSRFRCNSCNKSFVNVDNLKRHYMIHSGVRPFKCCFCKRTCTRKDTLATHLRNVHKKGKNTAKVMANEAAFKYLKEKGVESKNEELENAPRAKITSVVVENVLQMKGFHGVTQPPKALVKNQLKIGPTRKYAVRQKKINLGKAATSRKVKKQIKNQNLLAPSVVSPSTTPAFERETASVVTDINVVSLKEYREDESPIPKGDNNAIMTKTRKNRKRTKKHAAKNRYDFVSSFCLEFEKLKLGNDSDDEEERTNEPSQVSQRESSPAVVDVVPLNEDREDETQIQTGDLEPRREQERRRFLNEKFYKTNNQIKAKVRENIKCIKKRAAKNGYDFNASSFSLVWKELKVGDDSDGSDDDEGETVERSQGELVVEIEGSSDCMEEEDAPLDLTMPKNSTLPLIVDNSNDNESGTGSQIKENDDDVAERVVVCQNAEVVAGGEHTDINMNRNYNFSSGETVEHFEGGRDKKIEGSSGSIEEEDSSVNLNPIGNFPLFLNRENVLQNKGFHGVTKPSETPVKKQLKVGPARKNAVGQKKTELEKATTSINQKGKKRKSNFLCHLCPYRAQSSKRLENHGKLHEDGCKALVCEDCGWFVHHVGMHFHKARRHPETMASAIAPNSN
ncbi:unnamed protein product [Orchesella dallaii]|uniref:C2H2-type domain-containing protein n=1 Tax=Orchesella dallaii TaxID=48710 RepID=A0ABP1PTA6_9HEXA